MNGILNIDKPKDRTSFSIVAVVKRLSRERRVGHAGTLDPMATGILPICLGQSTRIIRFLQEARKTYGAEIELGITTDTYDASGNITGKGDPSTISIDQLEYTLTSFRGKIKQTPPMYSAVKHQGQPLYRLARAGIEIKRKSRSAEIYQLEIKDWRPPVVEIELECSKGTYIRSIAHDLGQLLGCGANLKSLIRLKYCLFNLENSVSLPQFEDAFHHGYWQQYIYPIDSVILNWRAVIISDSAERIIKNGGSLTLENFERINCGNDFEITSPPQSSTNFLSRAYSSDGRFLGLLRFDSGKRLWQTEKIFQ